MPDRLNAMDRIIDFLIGGSAIEAVRFFFSRNKNNAETHKIVSDNWRDYATKLEFRFNELEGKFDALSKKYYDLLEDHSKLKREFNGTSHHHNGGS